VGTDLFAACRVDKLVDQVDHRVFRLRVELLGVGIRQSQDVSGEFDNAKLHPQTDPQEHFFVFPGKADRFHLPGNTALPETSGDQDTVNTAQFFGGIFRRDRLTVDPVDLHFGTLPRSGVDEGFQEGFVGLLGLVLADKGDFDAFLRFDDVFGEFFPLFHIRFKLAQLQLVGDRFEDVVVEEFKRDLVDRLGIARFDNGVVVDVTGVGELAFDLLAQGFFAPADEHVRRNTDTAQLLDGVLRRFGLELFGYLDIRDQGHVDVKDIVLFVGVFHLADRFIKRKPFDIPDGSAQFDDQDIVASACRFDTVFDLVDDVGDDLDRLAQVIPLTLFGDNGGVDLAGGHTVFFAQ